MGAGILDAEVCLSHAVLAPEPISLFLLLWKS